MFATLVKKVMFFIGDGITNHSLAFLLNQWGNEVQNFRRFLTMTVTGINKVIFH